MPSERPLDHKRVLRSPKGYDRRHGESASHVGMALSASPFGLSVPTHHDRVGAYRPLRDRRHSLSSCHLALVSFTRLVDKEPTT